MKIVITGSSGFVGSRLAAYYQKKYEVWAPSHRELDFSDEKRALEAVRGFKPDVVIHCGAISDVNTCAQNPELSHAVNVKGAQYLARACARTGARFVFCSSDQVYFRAQGAGESRADFLALHREDEAPAPLPLYGQHKLMAEQYALAEQPDSVILRLTWMYGRLTQEELKKGRRNLLTTLEEALKKQAPVTFSKTDHRGVTDVAEVVRNMEAAWQLPAGVYNFGSSNDTSMYETVRRALAAVGQEALVQKGSGGSLRNLTMDTARLEKNGVSFGGSAERLGDAVKLLTEEVRTGRSLFYKLFYKL